MGDVVLAHSELKVPAYQSGYIHEPQRCSQLYLARIVSYTFGTQRCALVYKPSVTCNWLLLSLQVQINMQSFPPLHSCISNNQTLQVCEITCVYQKYVLLL